MNPFRNWRTPVLAGGIDSDEVFIWLAWAALAVIFGLSVWHLRPDERPPRQVVETFGNPFSGNPMVIWDRKAQRLTVLDSFPRAALLCIGERCELADGWVLKSETQPSK